MFRGRNTQGGDGLWFGARLSLWVRPPLAGGKLRVLRGAGYGHADDDRHLQNRRCKAPWHGGVLGTCYRGHKVSQRGAAPRSAVSRRFSGSRSHSTDSSSEVAKAVTNRL